MRAAYLLAVFLAILAFVVCEASAANVNGCLPMQQAAERLDHYGETPIGAGYGYRDRVVYTLWVAVNGEWTLTATQPNGLACVVQAGTKWFPQPARKAKWLGNK